MKRLVAIIVTTVAIALVGGSISQQPAAAGGWAVTTLDAYPTPVAGTDVSVGFTILQHGITPAQLEPSDKVGLELTAASGTTAYFPAVQTGAAGHYVATVTFSEAGAHMWTVYQGWFGPQELGPLTVESNTASASSDSGSTSYSAPAWLRHGLPLMALILGAYALVDVIGSRRHRSAAA